MDSQQSALASWETHPWVAEGQDRVRFGVGIVGPRRDWPIYLDLAPRAEGLGFDSFWIQDHPMGGLDCFTGLTALAQRTTTIRLGTLVCCIYYRAPALLARLAADVDCLSGGRLILGLGMGDHEPEFAQMGLTWPPVRERQAALAEAAQIIRGVWQEEPFSFHGHHFHVEDARVRPPVQRPRVPLLIAGGGERVTLRQVARYADMSNFGPHEYTGGAVSLDDVQRKFAALRRHCEELGRPYASVLRSHIRFPVVLAPTRDAALAKGEALLGPSTAGPASRFVGTPTELIAHYQDLVQAGMRYFIVAIWEADRETLDLMGERVLPALGAPSSPAP